MVKILDCESEDAASSAVPLTKTCFKCGLEKHTGDFYLRREKKRKDQNARASYCKVCVNRGAEVRSRKLKILAIQYKGGSCALCGYNKCPGALEFHHKDPEQKDFEISRVKSRCFDDKVRKELDKCDLLCSNCHRTIHYNGPLAEMDWQRSEKP